MTIYVRYFLWPPTIALVAASISVLISGYLIYRWNTLNTKRRSSFLSSMVLSSIFLWSVIGTSLIFCTALLDDYHDNPGQVVRTVFGAALLSSLAISAALTIVARKFATPRFVAGLTTGLVRPSQIEDLFSRLAEKMRVRAGLVQAKIGNAFSISGPNGNVVAVSPSMVATLSLEETEGVLAHELSHLRNDDSLAKGLARVARLAFPFDPVLKLLEPAVHRERELLADLTSIEFTGKPLALASALVKVHSGLSLSAKRPGTGFFVGGGKRGLLSFYPDLDSRVERLLQIAKHDRTSPALTIPA